MKKLVSLILTCALCAMLLSGCGGGGVELDTSMLSDYDYTRFQGQNMSINVSNWGEYLSIDEPS